MVKIVLYILLVMIISSCKQEAGKEKSNSPILIGHRGGMVAYPENSLISFEKAMEYTKTIEMDIYFTKDNVPIVIHDATLDRTTDCQGKVADKMWSEIKECRLKEKLDWNFSEYKLSRFKDILESKFLKDARLIVEIKDFNTDAIDKLLKLIGTHPRIDFESFDMDLLEYINNLFKNNDRKLYLISYKIPEIIPNYISGIIINKRYVTVSTKKEIGNKEVIVWTVDKKNDFLKLYKYDIDGIMTNDVRYFNKIVGD